MGFFFIFLSLIFLSADLPPGFLAACEQARLLQCKGRKQRNACCGSIQKGKVPVFIEEPVMGDVIFNPKSNGP